MDRLVCRRWVEAAMGVAGWENEVELIVAWYGYLRWKSVEGSEGL